jgi:hypothetical protein
VQSFAYLASGSSKLSVNTRQPCAVHATNSSLRIFLGKNTNQNIRLPFWHVIQVGSEKGEREWQLLMQEVHFAWWGQTVKAADPFLGGTPHLIDVHISQLAVN